MKSMYKRYTLAALLLISSLSADAFGQMKMDTIRRKDPGGWEFMQIRSYNVLMEEGYMHNGIKEGVWTTYWPSLYPVEIVTFRNGKKDGTSMRVTGKGVIELIENYKDDKLEGPRKVYSYDGGNVVEDAFYSEGKKHGPFIRWYANGKKQEVSSYVYDKRDGKATWFFEDGSMAAEYNYVNGEIDGDVATYAPGGKLAEYGKYKNGVQIGEWKEYYPTGKIKAEGKYVKGEKEGSWKQYNEEGQLAKTVKYVKGEEK